MPPSCLLSPLPVPTRRGVTARSGRNSLQVHIDLLTCRVWLFPTFTTATAETAARNFVLSVFRDVDPLEVLASRRRAA